MGNARFELSFYREMLTELIIHMVLGTENEYEVSCPNRGQ